MLDEEKIEAGWRAWLDAERTYRGAVYGVVHLSDGDVVYSRTVYDSGIERVVYGGLGLRPCGGSEIDRISEAMSQDRFSIVADETRQKRLLLRVYPPLTEHCSRKSAHPAIGGLGTISAVILPP